FSTALCDRAGRVVAQGLCLPLHLGAIPDAVEHLLDRYGGRIHPGDVFILNDPSQGGMHLPDIFLFQPIHLDGELIGFAVCVAHYPDIGGRVAGGNAVDSTEIFQEGLQIPAVKLYDRGIRNDALQAMILRNVRVPAAVAGDLAAQRAACRVGERQYIVLAERYTPDGLHQLIDELLNRTERRVRSELARLPDGQYGFADY
ncbi:MAG: hydantoinase B/oxoprolinase family protein, partial [Actinophytocola sp.]|nr:hydantoinase B/oxoprolinase family protein [Actinophytocola sp.]